MNALVLLLAVVIPFPLCWFRMKKFNIPLWKMLLIYLIVSIVGAVGASVGSAIAGESILSKRLYGLMLFDTVILFVLSALLKIHIDDMGDFVAVPIMAVCFASKIDCIVKGCCYGLVLFYSSSQQPVRFPSAIVEMAIWGILTVMFLVLERSGTAKGILWPLGMIWFGIIRFAVDFLRGSDLEKRNFLMGLTGGQFWSLIVLLVGFVYLYAVLKKKSVRKLTVKDYLYATIGILPAAIE